MSVQNLRNKFNQNNGSVPYNPPGLSYSKPSALNNNNNNNNINNKNSNGLGVLQQNGIGERFKTIREEPTDLDEKPLVATKNSSFLQNYLAGEVTKNTIQKPTSGTTNKFVSRSSPIAVTDVAAKLLAKQQHQQPASVAEVRSPPPTLKCASAYAPKASVKSGLFSPPPPPPPTFTSTFTPPIKPPPQSFSSSLSTSLAKSPATPNSLLGSVKSSPNGGEDRWKGKYEETEAKRKGLLTQNQKLLREKSDVERQVLKLSADLEVSNKELSERTLQLSQLRKLSEAMYKEYDQLKQQYELETSTLQKAMERASQWYKQNRELKRRSSALMQKVMSVAPSTLDDLADDTDGNDNDTEMEDLRKTVKELTQEVSRLQAELNKIKLQEFEAQEQTVDLTSDLEEERRARACAERELKELKMKHENLETVSRKVVDETTLLHQRYKQEKEESVKIRSDANKVKSERDVLARQSQLLMMDAASDEKIMKLLFEVEQLQRTVNEERQEHAEQLKDLQEKLESQSESEQIELYEEKLKLIEAELLCSQQRAEIAESQLNEFRKKIEETKTASPPPPPPPFTPPPPPPPPMSLPPPPPPPMALSTNLQTIKLKTVNTLNHANGDSNAIEEIGNYLGLPAANSKGPQVQNGAIDAIINQIKGGRFCLKSTDKEKQTLVKKQEPPPVVNEMMNVLGTLRRNPKRRASFKKAPADVAL